MKNIRNSILSGLVFGLLLGLFFAILYNFQYALIAGSLSGLTFGVAIYFFVSSKMVKQQTQIENLNGKEIIRSGGANHFMNSEAVGGKLYLMADKLYFKSHKFNIQNHSLEIPLKQISQIAFFNSLGFIPNGLKIHTTEGSVEKFVINDRKKWRNEIENIMK